MRFWDASAVVPLCLPQPASGRARELYEDDPEMAVWWGTPLECRSAFARLRREGVMAREERAPLRLLGDLAARWSEVAPGEALRSIAEGIVDSHPLRSGDALQLAAALEWAGTPRSEKFVTFDRRLSDAASSEGFDVLGHA